MTNLVEENIEGLAQTMADIIKLYTWLSLSLPHVRTHTCTLHIALTYTGIEALKTMVVITHETEYLDDLGQAQSCVE